MRSKVKYAEPNGFWYIAMNTIIEVESRQLEHLMKDHKVWNE